MDNPSASPPEQPEPSPPSEPPTTSLSTAPSGTTEPPAPPSGQPGAYGPPDFGPPNAPPGYGPPGAQGYGPPPGNGSPYGSPGYGPPPGYGPQYGYSGYGPPGAPGPPGYGPPPGYGYPGPPSGAPGYAHTPVPVDAQGRRLAEWWQRLLAILIDFALFVALTVAVDFTLLPVLSSSVTATNSGASLFFDASRSLLAAALAGLVTSTVTLGYFGLLEGRGRGQSLGKRALGIAVVDAATGGLIGTMRAVLRRVILFPNLLLVLVPIVGSLLGFV